MRSLRAEAAARLGGQLRWEQGWRGGVWNPFWRAHPEHYPFRDADGHISLRAFMDNLRWPHMLRLPTRPDDAWTDYSENVQGLAPYVSGSGRLFWVLARKKLLGAPDGRGYITILDAQEDPNHEDAIVFDKLFTDAGLRAEDFYHYGDPAVDGEYILIPMEGGTRPKLLIFRVIEDAHGEPVDVKFVTDEVMILQHESPAEAPWVAVFNGLILSSYFKGYPVRPAHGSESYLFVYAWDRQRKKLTAFDDKFFLFEKDGTAADVWRWQGCDISPGGRLFLASDRGESEGGGVHFFDLTTGIRLGRFAEDAGDGDYELEGVAAFDTSRFAVHQDARGSLLVCVLNSNWPLRDRVSILRWEVIMQEPHDVF